MNGSDVVAEGLHIFFSSISRDRKEKPEVGTEVGKGVQKHPTQIWPYL